MRTNELANKAKVEELSAKEKVEQQELHKVEAFRGGMRHHIEGMKVVNREKGADVTPEKLKQIQRGKRTSQQKVIAFIVEISYTKIKVKEKKT